jgi:hypothetical protein
MRACLVCPLLVKHSVIFSLTHKPVERSALLFCFRHIVGSFVSFERVVLYHALVHQVSWRCTLINLVCVLGAIELIEVSESKFGLKHSHLIFKLLLLILDVSVLASKEVELTLLVHHLVVFFA